MSRRARIRIAAVIGLALGAAAGWLVGWLARSDNAPFFVVLGALAGVWGGLAWARVIRPLVLAVSGLLALLLIAILFTPPRARIPDRRPRVPTVATSPAPRPDGLTADQAATLGSLRKVDDYPLYTMRYDAGTRSNTGIEALAGLSGQHTQPAEASNPEADLNHSRSSPPSPAPSSPHWALPRTGLFGCNFDWRYSPALISSADRPAAGGYASVSMVDIAYLGFGDGTVDLTTLPLAAMLRLLDAPVLAFRRHERGGRRDGHGRGSYQRTSVTTQGNPRLTR